MSMSKKDYEAVAKVLKERVQYHGRVNETGGAVQGTAVELAKVFAAGNPRFDMARFLAAAGAL